MQKKLTIQQILWRGFGTIFMLIFIANLVAQHTNKTLVKSLDNVTLSYKLLQELAELDMLLVEAETGQRGYLYTGKNKFLDPYNEANASINVQLAELKENIRNPKQQEKLGELETLIREKIDYLEKTIQMRKSGLEEEVEKIVSAGTGLEITAKLRRKITEIKETENQFLDDRKKLAGEAEIFSSYFAAASTLMIVGVGALISWVIIRNIAESLGIAVKVAEEVSAGNLTANISANYQGEIGKLLAGFQSMTQSLNSLIRQVQNSGIQVTASSQEIATSGKQLEATFTEQVASIRDVEVTTKEIAATSRQLKKTIEEITSTFKNTTIAAEGGRRNLSQMENTMRDLATATTSISSQLTNISEKAHKINQIIITITKVADQTNLLSLNAAIEAEKAGKYGMGFAVVARQIRRLADQTAVATLDIEKMVKEMQAAVSTGLTEMNKFTEEVNESVEDVESVSWQMTEIIEQVQAITPRFSVVNQGMEAQSEGAQQISEVMVYLSQYSSQTAGALREINGAICQLNEASQGLRQEISRFKVSNMDVENV